MSKATLNIVTPILIEVPSIPNFLRRAGGLDNETPIDVATLTLAQLEALGKAWTVELIAYAARRRALRETERSR